MIMIEKHSLAKEGNELILIVMSDISDRKNAEEAIYHLAFHDTLTDLPNRRSFMNQLQSEIVNQKYADSTLSVFFVDLDNFKQINDQWGHDIGDGVLKEAAKRIQSAIRPTDVAGRFGGDEFVVLLKDMKDKADANAIAKRILTLFQEPIHVFGEDYMLTCSIGVAHYPDHGQSPEELTKNADTALYYVKEKGKSDFKVFNKRLGNQTLERRMLEHALRQGIKNRQFYLEYQPKMNITTNELVGMEALTRWEHPEFGIISPASFIPLAEETGLIIPLGEWILRDSFRQITEWDRAGYPPLNLSVNISVLQLEDLNFVEKVKNILDETGIDPTRLEFEITESVLANINRVVDVLKDFQQLGIRISIDDFGTGYSSLSYVKELPIDNLKIDRSFVKDIHTNKESKEIAKTIIKLANSIGIDVIAEGIELKEHVDELSDDGCIHGQGYFYSRPLRVEAFEEYMTSTIEVH